jgi:hypothetical protein
MADAPIHVLLAPDREQRFWANVHRGTPETCWMWARAINGSGYGVVRHGARGLSYSTMAHRAAVIYATGEAIADGGVVDHTCGIRACCNPSHLRVVDQSANVRASSKHKAGNATVIRTGPVTIRKRGARYMAIWREYLADGAVRQAGRTFTNEAEALTCQHLTSGEPHTAPTESH